ncbi:MAG: DUF5661 family protein [Candidatus Nitrosotenuis sp.]
MTDGERRDISEERDSYKRKIAKKLGFNANELDNLSDEEIKIILKDIGKNDFKPDSDFDPKELERGIKVEMEHTNSVLVAKLICKDHLAERPDYYSRLEKVERAK